MGISKLKKKETYKDILSYLILALCVFASSYIFFNDGVLRGDDSWFHLTQIQDIYYGMRKGFWSLSPNHASLGALGIYVYQYYAPFPHYFSAFLLYLFNPIGMDATIALKTATVISIIYSAVYSYLLGKKITGNYLGGLIFGVVYIFNPYRIFCSMRRGAFAEAIAIGFIPAIYYGVYSLLNNKKFSFVPYVSLATGIPLIVLSHPYTAIMSVVFAIIYLIFNYKKVLKFIKNWKNDLFAFTTIILIIGSVSFYVLPMLVAQQEGLHRIDDPIIMLTNPSQLAGSTSNSGFFSGILDYSFIYYYWYYKQWDPLESPANYDYALIFFFASLITVIVVDSILEFYGKSKKIRLFIDFILLFVIANFVYQPIEFLMALFIFYAILVFYKIEGGRRSFIEQDDSKAIRLLKDSDFYFGILSLIVLTVLIFVPSIWSYVPSFMLKSQFSWRLWSLFYFILFFFCMVLLKYLKRIPFVNPVFIGGAVALIVLGQGLPLGRNVYQYNPSGKGIIWKMSDEDLKEVWYIGAQNEYLPKVFRENNYYSSYKNSLYDEVKRISYGYDIPYDLATYPKPAFLEGEGSLEMKELNSPNVYFSVDVKSEEALVQIPQFYNEGYVAHLRDGEDPQDVKGIYIDGLVSFVLPKGTYDVDVVFEGTKSYKVGKVLLILSLSGTFLMSLTGIYIFIQRNRYGKEINFLADTY